MVGALAAARARTARLGGGALFAAQFYGLATKRRLTAQRAYVSTACQLLLPVLIVLFALWLLGLANTPVGPRLPLTPAAAFGASNGGAPALATADDPTTAGLVPWLKEQGWAVDGGGAVACDATFPEIATNLSTYAHDHRAAAAAAPAALGVAANVSYRPSPTLPIDIEFEPVTLAFNATATHALPTLMASYHSAALSDATAGGYSLSAAAHPLPRTKRETAIRSAFLGIFASIIILIPFAFVAASFVAPLVRERESGSKQLQLVSGTPGVLYWLANWSWDLVVYAAVEGATLLVFIAMNRPEFVGDAQAFGATAALLALFGSASLALSSALSFAFKSPSTALIALIGLYFLSGFGLLIADQIMGVIDSTKDVNLQLRTYLYPLFPAYCLGRGFFVLSMRSAISQFIEPPPLYDPDQLGTPLSFLAAETAAYAVLTLLLQQLGAVVWVSRAVANLQATLFPAAAPSALVRASSSFSTASVEDASVRAERDAVELHHCGGSGGGGGGSTTEVSVSQYTPRGLPGRAARSRRRRRGRAARRRRWCCGTCGRNLGRRSPSATSASASRTASASASSASTAPASRPPSACSPARSPPPPATRSFTACQSSTSRRRSASWSGTARSTTPSRN